MVSEEYRATSAKCEPHQPLDSLLRGPRKLASLVGPELNMDHVRSDLAFSQGIANVARERGRSPPSAFEPAWGK